MPLTEIFVVVPTIPRCGRGAMLRHVLDPLALRIDVERDADPVSGCVSAGDGPERRFAGWTELFAALQDAVVADRAVRGPVAGSPGVGGS